MEIAAVSSVNCAALYTAVGIYRFNF